MIAVAAQLDEQLVGFHIQTRGVLARGVNPPHGLLNTLSHLLKLAMTLLVA
ncbi:virulence factor [Yersinia rohdei ATCC 43380]|nr:virulence factor [Yersinia rohdei ATCC 43380]